MICIVLSSQDRPNWHFPCRYRLCMRHPNIIVSLATNRWENSTTFSENNMWEKKGGTYIVHSILSISTNEFSSHFIFIDWLTSAMRASYLGPQNLTTKSVEKSTINRERSQKRNWISWAWIMNARSISMISACLIHFFASGRSVGQFQRTAVCLACNLVLWSS